MLFVNYVLDLNNGFRAKVVVEESKDIYLEYMDFNSITMKCTKLRTQSYRWAINDDIKWGLRVIQSRIHEWIVIIMIAYYTFVLAVSKLYIPKCCEKWSKCFNTTCMRLFQCTQCLELVYALAGLKIDEFSRAKMEATAKELIEEASFDKSCLNEQWSHLSLENEEDLINIWT